MVTIYLALCLASYIILTWTENVYEMLLLANLDTPFFVGFQTLEKLWAIAALITAGG